MAQEPEIEVESPEAPTTADAALAAALDEARGDEDLKPKVAAFFEAQTELARDQRHHMAVQFKLECKAKLLDNWSKRLKLVLQGMTAAVGAAALAAVGWMAWQAHEARGLVISPFNTPPGFAERGESGEVLAAQLQDKLLQMQRDTAALDQGAEVKADDDREFKVEIPETGISLGELQRLLRGWLSHETNVTGSVTQPVGGSAPGALVLSVRVGDEPLATPAQADGDLGALLQTASERVYERINPLRYAAWLTQHGRAEEGFAVMRRVAQTGTDAEKSRANVFLSQNLMSLTEERGLLHLAAGYDPNNSTAWNNLGTRESNRQLAVLELRKAVATMGATFDKTAPRIPEFNLAEATGDFDRLSTLLCANYRVRPCDDRVVADRALTTAGDGASSDPLAIVRRSAQAGYLALFHDTSDARRMIDAPRPDASQQSARVQAEITIRWMRADIMTRFAESDWPGVLAVADTEQMRRSRQAGDFTLTERPPELVRIVEAFARLGRFSEAEGELARWSSDEPDAAMARAVIADLKGDRAGADRWFAAAERAGPDLPFADTRWAQALLTRGDADGAVAKAKTASKISPHYSDALEVWGEALLAKGDYGGAAPKFADAAKFAPYWGRLHLKWAEALSKAGKADAARAQKQAAAAEDLTPAEHAELNGLRL
jgi:tetratricopeptide (TPR) repeat protein